MSKEPSLTHAFFQRFYPWCRAHGIEIETGVARSQDEKRAAKMTEAVVRRHFHGEFGLEAELIDAVPMGRLEALPHVWAQKGLVQGPSMHSCKGAPQAWLQPCCAGIGQLKELYSEHYPTKLAFFRHLTPKQPLCGWTNCSVWMCVGCI